MFIESLLLYKMRYTLSGSLVGKMHAGFSFIHCDGRD